MSPPSVAAAETIRPGALIAPLGVWVFMAVLAVANGGFREAVLVPRVGEYPGRAVSTALLVAAVLGVSFVFFSRTPIEYATAELVVIGVGWTLLTVGFEFLVGAVEGTPPSVMIGQYDVLAGRAWVAVPLALLFSPLLFGR